MRGRAVQGAPFLSTLMEAMMAFRSLLAALCLTALAYGPVWAGQPSLLPAVEAFAREARVGLESIDRNLSRAARDLAKSGGLASPEARKTYAPCSNPAPRP